MAVKESKDRVRAALINSHFEFPTKRITINLAPADLPKEGGRFDLPIALGILAASGQIPKAALDNYEFIGELALGGQLRAVKGSLPTAIECGKNNRQLILPTDNAQEASLAEKTHVLPANNLLDTCSHLTRQTCIKRHTFQIDSLTNTTIQDLSDVKGQQHAKRALEIAAAGQHNLLMIGPPGTGKTMLASRLPGILPPMTDNEAIESAAIASISGEGFNYQNWGIRPFRSPHHTASGVALVGGGSSPRPGEISLAHNGVLFLDELAEFDRKVLDVLREPIEKGRIIISRAARQAEYPAKFQMIAAMNPCPCGEMGNPKAACRCTEEQIRRYQSKISGPVLDRIDLHVRVPKLANSELSRITKKTTNCDNTQTIRNRVALCRKKQITRAGVANAHMNNKQVEHYCQLSAESITLLNKALDKLGLSARAYHRILKIARTIADLAESDAIETKHLSEAISYRTIDRNILG